MGADWNALLLLYRSLIRSKVDYGNFKCWLARKSYLKTLDLIYHGGLRLVLGAFRTSPAESLYAEANEAPANIRSHKLALLYYVKLKLYPVNPAYNNAFYLKYKELFQKNKKAIKPFGLRMGTIIGEVDMDLTEIHKTLIPDIPPWTKRTPNINLTIFKFHRNRTRPLIFQEELQKVKERYPKHSHIFTDGSKLEKITGCATVHEGKISKKKKIKKKSPKWHLYIQHKSLCNQHGSWPHLTIKE